MPAVTTYSPTGNAYLDGMLFGTKWAVSSFTFSFPSSGSYYESNYGSREPTNGFEALTSTQQAVTRTALSMYAAVANLSFSEVSESSTQHADLRFAESNVPSTAWAYYPYSGPEGGDAWFNNSSNYYDSPYKGNYAYSTFMHEIGHALGLKHPHEADGSFNAMPTDRDSLEYTVMSYRSYIGASTTTGYTNETWGYPQSLMMYDIAGMQQLYGANYNTNSDHTTYAWDPITGQLTINGVGQGAPGANRIFMTTWDGNGIDTYNFSSYGTNLKVDLQPGAWTTTSPTQLAYLGNSKYAVGNIANALLYGGNTQSLIENAIGGAGADMITGNVAANALTGNAGGDKLYGLAGDDRLTGGAANDLLDGGGGFDTAAFSGLSTDYSWSQNADGSWTMFDKRTGSPDGTDTLWVIENLAFSDTSLALTITTTTTTTTSTPVTTDQTPNGDGSANTLTGGSGNDTLDGKGGNDKLYGMGGTDVLIGGAGADLLDGGEGTDAASYATAAAGVVADLKSRSNNTGDAYGDTYVGIEDLFGSAYADDLRGDDGRNSLTAGAGDDKLRAYGGDDYLNGSTGTDTAIFGAKSSNYSWAQNSDGSWTVRDLRSGSPDGSDILVNVEVLKFSNKSVTLPSSTTMSSSATSSSGLKTPENIPLPVAYSDSFDFAKLTSTRDDFRSFLSDIGTVGPRLDRLDVASAKLESRTRLLDHLPDQAKVATSESETWKMILSQQSDWWQAA